MSWINTRCSDLDRIPSGVQRSARYVLDQGGDIEELDRIIQAMEKRLAHLRRHVDAVSTLRKQSERPARGGEGR